VTPTNLTGFIGTLSSNMSIIACKNKIPTIIKQSSIIKLDRFNPFENSNIGEPDSCLFLPVR
jgi:hypothetical protein